MAAIHNVAAYTEHRRSLVLEVGEKIDSLQYRNILRSQLYRYSSAKYCDI